MNRFRHLQARHAVERGVLYLALFLLALRLLFPTGLMLDTSVQGGDPALVICSGHGALVLPATLVGADGRFTPNTTAIRAFEHTALHADSGGADGIRGTQGTRPPPASDQSGSAASGEICPFSAAFALALTALAVALVFRHFVAPVAVRYRLQRFVFVQRFVRSSPGARAPPLLA